jgi:hypothetical protein
VYDLAQRSPRQKREGTMDRPVGNANMTSRYVSVCGEGSLRRTGELLDYSTGYLFSRLWHLSAHLRTVIQGYATVKGSFDCIVVLSYWAWLLQYIACLSVNFKKLARHKSLLASTDLLFTDTCAYLRP